MSERRYTAQDWQRAIEMVMGNDITRNGYTLSPGNGEMFRKGDKLRDVLAGLPGEGPLTWPAIEQAVKENF